MLRVFTDEDGNGGDIASVIIDENGRINASQRQDLARVLNTGETIFVNDLATAAICVMHPQGEIDFAGVGVLATAWLLGKQQGNPIKELQGRKGGIIVCQEKDLVWVEAANDSLPAWNLEQLADAAAVDAIKLPDTLNKEHTLYWAWIDEPVGLARARTFAADWDIPEAMGNGSGVMLLASRLGRELIVQHGDGAIIYARPVSETMTAVGGRVAELPDRIL